MFVVAASVLQCGGGQRSANRKKSWCNIQFFPDMIINVYCHKTELVHTLHVFPDMQVMCRSQVHIIGMLLSS